jgi:hypothetical protein
MTGLYPSLAFGPSGRPAFSYYFNTRGDLRLAMRGRAGWSYTTVDAAGDAGRSTSLAVDPVSGRWDIAYVATRTHTRATVQMAHQTRRGWNIETVDRLPGDAAFLSLAYAPDNNPSLSYYDAANADLKFAPFDGHRWRPVTVASRRSQDSIPHFFTPARTR